MKNFYQICYGKPNKTDWTYFNMSENTPSNIMVFFTKVAKSNSPEFVDSSFSEEKKNFFELTSNDGMVEISKVQYGSTDIMGRPTMFVHGFVFSAEDNILKKPNELLAVSNDNFKFSVEETKDIPSSLIVHASWTVKSAMDYVGIQKNHLESIMALVNYSLASSTSSSSYIIYNGTEEQKKALIYLVLHFLPYPLRYELSFSTADNLNPNFKKNIIITDKEDQNGYCVNLQTGSYDFDWENVESDKSKYPFYNEFKNSFDNFDKFCNNFQKVQETIGYKFLSPYKDLLFIYEIQEFLIGNKTLESFSQNSQEFQKFVFEFLGKAPFGKNAIDSFIASMLEEYVKQDLPVNEFLMNYVTYRSEKTENKSLKSICEKLQAKFLLSDGIDNAVEFLQNKKEQNADDFNKWSKLMANIGNEEVVDKYFDEQIKNVKSYDELNQIFEEIVSINEKSSSLDLIKEKLIDLAYHEMIKKPNSSGYYDEVLDLCSESYVKMFKDDNSSVDILDKVVDKFWEGYDIQNFEFNSDYITNIKSIRGNKFEPVLVYSFSKMYTLIESVINDDCEKNRNNLIEELDNLNNKYKFIKSIKDKIATAILNGVNKERNLDFWYKIALFDTDENKGSQAIANLILWNIDVFIDNDCFDKFLNCSGTINIIFINIFSNAVDIYFDEVVRKSDDYYLLKERSSQLSKRIKAYNKEEKRKSKNELNDDSNDSSNSKNKFRNLFSKR